MPEPMTQEWLDLVDEDVVDPGRRIVDPHHHLWPPGGALPYGLADLHADAVGGGHRVVRTVFVECGAAYDRRSGDRRAPIAETRFVAGESQRDPRHLIGGIVSHTDLRDHELFTWAQHRLSQHGYEPKDATRMAMSLVVLTQYKDLLQMRKAS